jgi:hypothetical protein
MNDFEPNIALSTEKPHLYQTVFLNFSAVLLQTPYEAGEAASLVFIRD